MTIPARFSGVCPECGERWQPGDLIRSVADRDADGLPVVRTVGDLTLRQLRARPQIRIRVGDNMGTLYTRGREVKLITRDGAGLVVPVTLDTPCEVLP